MISQSITIQRLCYCFDFECVQCDSIKYLSECFRVNQVLVNEIVTHSSISNNQTIYGLYGFNSQIGAHIQWLRFDQIQPLKLEFYYHQLIRSQTMHMHADNFLDLFESTVYHFGNFIHQNHLFNANDGYIEENIEYWYNIEQDFRKAFVDRSYAQHEEPGLRLPIAAVPIQVPIVEIDLELELELDESGYFDENDFE